MMASSESLPPAVDAAAAPTPTPGPPPSLFLDDLPSDSLLNILSHLNVVDLSLVSCASRRLCFLTDAVQTVVVGPECVALSELAAATAATAEARKKHTFRGGRRAGKHRPAEVVRRALRSMRAPPTVAFAFHSSRSSSSHSHSSTSLWYQEPPGEVERLLPDRCAVLSAASSDVQANCGGLVEADSGFGILLASFDRDRTSFVPFDFSPAVDDDDDSSSDGSDGGGGARSGATEPPSDRLLSELRQATPPSLRSADSDASRDYWKIIFVYAAGDAGGHGQGLDEFVNAVQAAHPHASVVGGVCDGGHVRLFPGNAKGGGSVSVSNTSGNAEFCVADELSGKTTRQLRKVIVEQLGRIGADVEVPPDATRETLMDMAAGIFKNDKDADARSSGSSGGGTITEVQRGIFGLAIGGDVPVRTVVSRGVRSLTTGDVSLGSSPWSVSDATVVRLGDANYPFAAPRRGEDPSMLRPVHIIDAVRNRDTGECLDGVRFLFHSGERPEFVGLKLRRRAPGAAAAGGGGGGGGEEERDGFDLTMLDGHNVMLGRLMIMDETATAGEEVADLRGTEIDVFKLDGPACLEDVDIKLDRLRELVTGQRILGAIMFSCSGRGPGAGYLIEEPMADARRFHDRFPNTPCLGFYAGGEIGPRALAGNANIFQSGRAAVQGFTSVFALFIVPDAKVDNYFDLDDSPESIARHMEKKRLG